MLPRVLVVFDPHMTLTDTFRSVIRGKTRIGMAWLFAVALLWFARTTPQTPGILICFIGATIRFWASGYLRKDSRPAVGGPYAWTRNPLYLGTYLMAVGVAASIENWPLLGVTSVVFAVVYHFIILDEEVKLHGLFGAPYKRYCELVPRFFPRLWPIGAAPKDALSDVNPEPAHRTYDWALSKQNKAFEAYVSFVALIGLVWICAELWSRA